MSIFVRCILICAIVVLSGCQMTMREKHYEYVPPKSMQDKRCVSRCTFAKSQCERICDMKHASCITQAKSEQQAAYNAYVRVQKRKGLPIRKHLKDFDKRGRCRQLCQCIPSFNTCYQACGGTVYELVAGL